MKLGLWLLTGLTAGLTATVSIAGFSKYTASGATVGQKVDQTIDGANTAATDALIAASRTVRLAERAAHDAVNGVRTTVEEVGTVVDDSSITASIKTALLKEAGFGAVGIDVNTVRGEVSLKGAVNSESERERAQQIAAAVAGVTGVKNDIAVRATAARAERLII